MLVQRVLCHLSLEIERVRNLGHWNLILTLVKPIIVLKGIVQIILVGADDIAFLFNCLRFSICMCGYDLNQLLFGVVCRLVFWRSGFFLYL